MTTLATLLFERDELVLNGAGVGGRGPVAEVIDARQVVFVADHRSGKRPMARAAKPCGPERRHRESGAVCFDLLGVRRIGEQDGGVAQREARVPVWTGRLDAVTDEAGDPCIREGVAGRHLLIDVAGHEKKRVVASRAEPAFLVSSLLAKPIDTCAVPGVVE